MKKTILQLKKISKSFVKEDGSNLDILDDINIEFHEGEIVGILGRSGCGKSTLLRIITGLTSESKGKILCHNKPASDKNNLKMSMVFQAFGLFPWLTIYENVAIGLRASGLDEAMIEKKVSMGIKLAGLGGFECAYPREISSGMRQRVGFARAIVVDPEILILDEPFSALDYLTGQVLKSDLLDIWFERSISSIKSIILVTHSIEEALTLCDRVILLSSNPGRVIANIAVNIAHPRDHDSIEFQALTNKVYAAMTKESKSLDADAKTNIYRLYPQAPSIRQLIGFMNSLKNNYDGKAKLSEIAKTLRLTYQNVLPIAESLVLLKFADITGDEISLSSSGNILLDADDYARNVIIQEHLVQSVDYVKKLYRKIQDSPTRTISKKAAMEILKNDFYEPEAQAVFEYTINWSRYVRLLAYNAKKAEISLFPKPKTK